MIWLIILIIFFIVGYFLEGFWQNLKRKEEVDRIEKECWFCKEYFGYELEYIEDDYRNINIEFRERNPDVSVMIPNWDT